MAKEEKKAEGFNYLEAAQKVQIGIFKRRLGLGNTIAKITDSLSAIMLFVMIGITVGNCYQFYLHTGVVPITMIAVLILATVFGFSTSLMHSKVSGYNKMIKVTPNATLISVRDKAQVAMIWLLCGALLCHAAAIYTIFDASWVIEAELFDLRELHLNSLRDYETMVTNKLTIQADSVKAILEQSISTTGYKYENLKNPYAHTDRIKTMTIIFEVLVLFADLVTGAVFGLMAFEAAHAGNIHEASEKAIKGVSNTPKATSDWDKALAESKATDAAKIAVIAKYIAKTASVLKLSSNNESQLIIRAGKGVNEEKEFKNGKALLIWMNNQIRAVEKEISAMPSNDTLYIDKAKGEFSYEINTNPATKAQADKLKALYKQFNINLSSLR